MQSTDLKNPGIDQLAQTTRMNVAKLISNVANEANPSGEVAAFLLDAATKAPGYVAPSTALPDTQRVLKNGDALNIDGQPTVATLKISKTNLSCTIPATHALVSTKSVTFGGVKYTITVAGGAITNITSEPVA